MNIGTKIFHYSIYTHFVYKNYALVTILFQWSYLPTELKTDINLGSSYFYQAVLFFFFLLGISFDIEHKIELLTISATVPEKFKNVTKGLFGNFNGNPEDDFVFRDGTTIPGNSSEETIYGFGQSCNSILLSVFLMILSKFQIKFVDKLKVTKAI